MIFFQVIQGIFQRGCNRWDIFQLLWWQTIDIFIERLTRINLVLNTIQPCHHLSSKCYVAISRSIRSTIFNPSAIVAAGHRNPQRCRTITVRIGQIDRCFKSWNQTLVRVGRRVGKGTQRFSMLYDTTNVIHCGFGQSTIAITGK